jgi:hypothetical protein
LREKDFSIEIKTIGNSRTKEIGDKEKNKEPWKTKKRQSLVWLFRDLPRGSLKPSSTRGFFPSTSLCYFHLLLFSCLLPFYFLLGFVTGLFFHISFLTVSIRGLSFFLFRAIKIQQLSRIRPQWRRYALPWRAA